MKLIDKAELDKLLQGDESLLADLAIMFAQYFPDTRSRMRLAIADRDPTALQESAHQLKSRLAYFGATTLNAIAAELEVRGRDNDLQGVEPELDTLLFGCCDLMVELNELTGLSLSISDA